MHTYNTTIEPIRLKKYGRNLQNIIVYIAELKDKQTQETYVQTLLELIQSIFNNQPNHVTTNFNQLFNEIFIASDQKLNLNPPSVAQAISIKSEPLTYNTHAFSFKCCGTHLTNLIQILLNKDNQQQPVHKEHILALVKLVHNLHKKRHTLANTIQHIEQVAKHKMPISHEEIEQALQQKITAKSIYPHPNRKNKTH